MSKMPGTIKTHLTKNVPTLLFAGLLFLPFLVKFGSQEAHPPTPHRHPEAQKLKNPIPTDDSSVAEGRKTYLRHCASCHGPSGKGDGSMALAGGTPSNPDRRTG